ncbi:MAG TPA: hypothetical protein VGF27_17055 [Pseudoduganella sp.]
MALFYRIAGFTALALSLNTAYAAASPKAPKKYTIEQFMATTSISGASFSPDEKQILFNSNESGIFNAYTIPVNGGKPVAMTKSTVDSTFAVGFFRNDNRILFTRDQGGNEQNHLFVRESGGEEKDLTPGDKLKAMFFGWTQDGNAFYVLTNERNPKFFDLYRYDAKDYARTMIYQNDDGITPSEISRDGKWLALDKPNTTSDSDIYLYNLATKEKKHITPHTEPATYEAATFDPESKKLLFKSNAGGEFTSIRSYELATGAVAEDEKAAWDLMGAWYSRNGQYRLSSVNQDGSTVLRVVDAKTGKPLPLPKLPGGEMRGAVFSDSGKLLAFYINGDRSPNNLYVYDLKTRKASKLTESLNKEINPDDLVEAEVVRFKSFDGTGFRPSITSRKALRRPARCRPWCSCTAALVDRLAAATARKSSTW